MSEHDPSAPASPEQNPDGTPRSVFSASSRPRLRSERSALAAGAGLENFEPRTRAEARRAERAMESSDTSVHETVAEAPSGQDVFLPSAPLGAGHTAHSAPTTPARHQRVIRGDSSPADDAPSAGAAAGEMPTPAAGAPVAPPAGASALPAPGTAGATAPSFDSITHPPQELEHLVARHARAHYDAFPSVVGWTSLGTALPGLALLRARKFTTLGWVLLGGFVLGIVTIVGWVLWRGPIKAVARVISSPTILDALAVLLAVGLVVWLAVIVVQYLTMKRHQQFNRVQKALGGVLVASLAIVVGVPLGIGATYARVQGRTIDSVFGGGQDLDGDGRNDPVTDADTLFADQERVTVYLIGRDSGEGRTGTRVDTQLVASIDPRTGDSTVISIPRNLAMPIFPEGSELAERWPNGFQYYGTEQSMINAVWTWAEEEPSAISDPQGLEPGMFATMQAVEGSLGIDLDYYASVDMEGFEDLVDALGGVEIDVERPIPLGGGKNANTGAPNPIYDWIDPGMQTLDGKHALWYVRSREGADNYDRMCRQQRMIETTLGQMNPQELAVAYPKLASSLGSHIQTSIPQNELSAFVELAAKMQTGEMEAPQINNDVTPTYAPDYDELHEWVRQQIDGAGAEGSDGAGADGTGEGATGGSDDEANAGGTVTGTSATAAAATSSELATLDLFATSLMTAGTSGDLEGGAADGAGEDASATDGAAAEGGMTADGKCYPKGYVPGSGWPGYPGPDAEE